MITTRRLPGMLQYYRDKGTHRERNVLIIQCGNTFKRLRKEYPMPHTKKKRKILKKSSIKSIEVIYFGADNSDVNTVKEP